MKLFLPTFKDAFRLTAPLTLKKRGWTAEQLGITELPAGTVVKLSRYKLNRTTNPDKAWVGFTVHASPDARIAMKKHGGSLEGGLDFSILLREARELEVELVEDFK